MRSYRDYNEERRDPRWQKLRLKVMQRDNFQCVRCGDSESELQVHHTYYVGNRKPWQYPEFSLWTLCRQCHKEFMRQEETRLEGTCLVWEIRIEKALAEQRLAYENAPVGSKCLECESTIVL
jgi:hypothetical protein